MPHTTDPTERPALAPVSEQILHRLHCPIWVFDIARECMVWCNAAAVRLWGAPSRDELLGRDWSSTMSDVVRQRLADYLRRFQMGETLIEQWTFFPEGKVVTVDCHCSGIELADGSTGMLVESSDGSALVDASSIRSLEAIRHTPLLVSVFDENGKALTRNPAAMAARPHPCCFRDNFAEPSLADETLGRLFGEGRVSLETEMNRADEVRWHRLDIALSHDPASGNRMVVMSEVDVSDRIASVARHRASLERLEAVIHGLDVAILLESRNRSVLVTNQAFCEMFDIPLRPSELVGRDCRKELARLRWMFAEPDTFENTLAAVIQAGTEGRIEEVALHDGRILQLDYAPVRREGNDPDHLWIYRDVTRFKARNAHQVAGAGSDCLTGLPTREWFDKASDRTLRDITTSRQCEAALLLITIDDSKAFRDVAGIAESDRLLRLLADCLRENSRDEDSCFRLGPDEFGVLMPGMSLTTAEQAGQRLLGRLNDIFVGTTPAVTVSIGVTEFRDSDASAAQALARADAALYQARHQGGDQALVLS